MVHPFVVTADGAPKKGDAGPSPTTYFPATVSGKRKAGIPAAFTQKVTAV